LLESVGLTAVVIGSLQKQRRKQDAKSEMLPKLFITQSCSLENCGSSQLRSVYYNHSWGN